MAGFNDSWIPTTLSAISSYRKTHRTSTKKNYVSTENILQNYQGIERFTSDESVSGDGFNCDDILMGNIRPYLKKVCLANFDGVCNADVLVFKSESVNPRFLHCILANDNFINYVMSSVKGSKMPRGDKGHIMQYPLSIPRAEEQAKIADFIALLNERIDTQSKIIEKLQSFMKSICHTIFNKDKTKKLGDCVVCHASTLIEADIENSPSGIYPVFGATGVIRHIDTFDIEGNAILVLKDGANAGKIQFAKTPHSVIGTSNYLTPKDNTILKYVYFALLDFNFDKYKVGSGIPHIYFKDYKEEKIYYPSYEKQTCIVKLLSSIENKIDLESIYLDKLKEQKKYLLSNMFI